MAHRFSVQAGIENRDGTRLIKILGPDPVSGEPVSLEHRVGSRHGDFLDMFERLAGRFGARLPRGRETIVHPPAPRCWQPRLTEITAPENLYGYGDPAVFRHEVDGRAAHYLYVTSNDAPDAFPILRSNDLGEWEPRGFVFPEGAAPVWAASGPDIGDFWAPELHHIGPEDYLLAFTARGRSGGLSIGIARSRHPEGPFDAGDRPLLSGGMIDPHLFVDDDGSAWLLWKEDSNGRWPKLLAEAMHENPDLIATLFPEPRDAATAGLAAAFLPWASTLGPMERFFLFQPLIEAVVERLEELSSLLKSAGLMAIQEAMRTPIHIQQLDPAGLELVGEPSILLVNDLSWEGHLIEGPWLTHQQGRYYLFYAGNDFSTPDYGIGVAVSESLLGPYRKQGEPLLRSSMEWIGPGHPSVAADAAGNPHLFFHAFRRGELGYKAFRAMLSAPLLFQDGTVSLADA